MSTPTQTLSHRLQCLCPTSPRLRPPTGSPPWWSLPTPDARRAFSTATPTALIPHPTPRGAPKGGLCWLQRTPTPTGTSAAERATPARQQTHPRLTPLSCPALRPSYAPSHSRRRPRWQLFLTLTVNCFDNRLIVSREKSPKSLIPASQLWVFLGFLTINTISLDETRHLRKSLSEKNQTSNRLIERMINRLLP